MNGMAQLKMKSSSMEMNILSADDSITMETFSGKSRNLVENFIPRCNFIMFGMSADTPTTLLHGPPKVPYNSQQKKKSGLNDQFEMENYAVPSNWIVTRPFSLLMAIINTS